MNKHNRVIIIGLDGVPYSLIKDLAQKKVMPNMGRIVKEGTFRQMSSSIPEISSVAWSSVITGKNPGEHGIFGFTEFPIGTYRLSFPNFNDLKAPVFWNNPPTPSVIINVPSTYPASTMQGMLISGFVSPSLEKAVYPASLLSHLRQNNYKIDVDSSKAHQSFDMFLSDLNQTLQSRIETYRYLWGKEDWEIFMLVFTGTDRLMHFLWDAYEDEAHKYHSQFLEHFSKIDEVVGEIAEKCHDKDTLLFLSDHGFGRLNHEVNINYLLRKEGFLKSEDFASINYDTKAFALDPARIYINLKGKYPRGNVEIKDVEKIVEDLINLFESLEFEGEKIIKKIFRKEDIYSGPYMQQAPDMVLVGNDGFNLKASIKAEGLLTEGIFTGKHTQEDAFFLMDRKVPGNMLKQNISVFDFVDTLTKIKT